MTATAQQHTPAQESAIYVAALHALSSHIAEHHLGFTWIEAPGFGDPLQVRVRNADHHAWLSTVEILAESNEPAAPIDGQLIPKIKTVWEVRLPDTGTRVQVRTWRDIPFAGDLRAVS